MTVRPLGHLSRLWVHSHVVWMRHIFLMLIICRCHWHETCIVKRALAKHSWRRRSIPVWRPCRWKSAAFISIVFFLESKFEKTCWIWIMLRPKVFRPQGLYITVWHDITIVSHRAKSRKLALCGQHIAQTPLRVLYGYLPRIVEIRIRSEGAWSRFDLLCLIIF